MFGQGEGFAIIGPRSGVIPAALGNPSEVVEGGEERQGGGRGTGDGLHRGQVVFSQGVKTTRFQVSAEGVAPCKSSSGR